MHSLRRQAEILIISFYSFVSSSLFSFATHWTQLHSCYYYRVDVQGEFTSKWVPVVKPITVFAPSSPRLTPNCRSVITFSVSEIVICPTSCSTFRLEPLLASTSVTPSDQPLRSVGLVDQVLDRQCYRLCFKPRCHRVVCLWRFQHGFCIRAQPSLSEFFNLFLAKCCY